MKADDEVGVWCRWAHKMFGKADEEMFDKAMESVKGDEEAVGGGAEAVSAEAPAVDAPACPLPARCDGGCWWQGCW